MQEPRDIYILGAGSVARDALFIYESLGKRNRVRGFVIEKRYYSPENKKIDEFDIFDDSILENISGNPVFLCAIGSPKRSLFVEKIVSLGFEFDTLVHPSSSIGKDVTIGLGTIIYPHVCITRDVEIGNHVIINVGSSISHNCKLSDYSTIGPGVDLAGHVFVDEGSFLGIGSSVINKTSIGKYSCIGAGSTVTSDIPDNALAVGTPAKKIKDWSDKDWEKIL